MKPYTRLDEYQKAFGIKDLADVKFVRPTSISVVSKLGQRTNEAYSGAIYKAPITAPEVPEDRTQDIDYTKGYEITPDDDGNILSFAYNVDPNTNEKIVLKGVEAENKFFQYFGALYARLQKDVEQETTVTPLGRNGR